MRTAMVLGLALFVVALTSAVHAEVLIHEPFDYAVGDIDGQDGGVGFDGEWIGDAGFLDQIQVAEPDTPLSYTVPGGATINGGDRALRLLNDTPDVIADVGSLVFREFATVLDGDDIYFSYLYRFAGGEVNDNDFVVWWFNDRPDPTPNIGLKGNRGDGSGPEDLMARFDNDATKMEWTFDDISEDAGTIGTDFLIVGHLWRAGNSDDPNDYDQYDLWVNPSMDEQDSPHAEAFAAPEDSNLYEVFALGMRAFNQEPDDEMLWDELRFGTTWEDVVGGTDGAAPLQAGDANMDYEFNQLDLVQVQIAAKYLTGQPATWGDGDWDGAPGGEPGSPPAGNGAFDQLDIIAALGAGKYLTGPYNAILPDGTEGDGQTSIVYNANTGEVGVDAPAGTNVTSVNIDSAASIFMNHENAQNLDGSFDTHSENNIFKATFGSSFGSLSFGTVSQAGLAEDFVASDLTVIGSLEGGGGLGEVDLVYIPEPSTVALLVLGLASTLGMRRRRTS
jgi:hypothetical protein